MLNVPILASLRGNSGKCAHSSLPKEEEKVLNVPILASQVGYCLPGMVLRWVLPPRDGPKVGIPPSLLSHGGYSSFFALPWWVIPSRMCP